MVAIRRIIFGNQFGGEFDYKFKRWKRVPVPTIGNKTLWPLGAKTLDAVCRKIILAVCSIHFIEILSASNERQQLSVRFGQREKIIIWFDWNLNCPEFKSCLLNLLLPDTVPMLRCIYHHTSDCNGDFTWNLVDSVAHWICLGLERVLEANDY